MKLLNRDYLWRVAMLVFWGLSLMSSSQEAESEIFCKIFSSLAENPREELEGCGECKRQAEM